MLFLNRAACCHRPGTALDGAAIDTHILDRTEIKLGAGIAALFSRGVRRAGNVELGDFGHENPRK